ncbi:hypothetical protein I79_007290 [Cricetulus griseus]|uniref:Uncharacterized protein n=1 Tax=Cricetulus griseus TaxID=10029 RepID=G3HA48_CRIGR|nr:hypothetical protein I79_007290 [Cricetulus griseus]
MEKCPQDPWTSLQLITSGQTISRLHPVPGSHDLLWIYLIWHSSLSQGQKLGGNSHGLLQLDPRGQRCLQLVTPYKYMLK